MCEEIIKEIKDFERNFPKLMSDFEQREWGLLFYNTDNPTSHDSNHAVILSAESIDKAVKEIKDFYLGIQVIPRIYPSLEAGQLQLLTPSLLKHGFKITREDKFNVMVLSKPCSITVSKRLEFARLFKADDLLIDGVYDEDQYGEGENAKVRIKKVFERKLKNEECHLLAGFLNDVPVTAAFLEYNDKGIARVDSVETGLKFRGHGYARELIRYLAEYHKTISKNLLYLYSENHSAIKIYREAGFETIDSFEEWKAFFEA